MTQGGGTLAARLKRLRDAAGLTQQELATRAGLSMSMISQLEQGLKEDPRLSTLRALARTLNVTLDELAGGTGEPEEKPKRRGRK
jgi:transcriptional regulator with XRE-family HTH domain